MRILIAIISLLLLSTFAVSSATLDEQLTAVLAQHGFTGRVESTLETRLGRKLDNQLADLRHCRRIEQRQQLLRLSLTDERFWRYSVNRHRDR
jgi:hypothetical protein